MLFNSLQYALFLPLVVAAYFRLRHREQNLLLLGASYLFYSFWDWRFLFLIVLSTAVDFVAGGRIHAARGRGADRTARRWLVASVATNLGILGAFKYFGFFVENLNALLGAVGLGSTSGLLEVALPVGISFYTFQSLSYTIDVHRGRLEPEGDPVRFALFVAFFPQLVAGPIERATHLLPQIRRPRVVTRQDWEEGIGLILMGLVRKVAVADTAAVFVDRIFAEPAGQTSLQLAAGLVLYAIQVYGDFAGYSNIARGSARLFGFHLMRNFRHPFFAQNPADFWHRWHISLMTWIRDYVFIPLGGSRKGRLRTYVNLVVTLLLSGLWHGAAWTYVLFGLYHGVLLAAHRLFREWRGSFRASLPSEAEERAEERRERGAEAGRGRWPTPAMLARGVVTFAAVTGSFIMFRAGDMGIVLDYLRGLGTGDLGGKWVLVPVAVLGGLLLAIDAPQALAGDEWVFQRGSTARRVVFAALAVLLVALGGQLGQPFVYFQF